MSNIWKNVSVIGEFAHNLQIVVVDDSLEPSFKSADTFYHLRHTKLECFHATRAGLQGFDSLSLKHTAFLKTLVVDQNPFLHSRSSFSNITRGLHYAALQQLLMNVEYTPERSATLFNTNLYDFSPVNLTRLSLNGFNMQVDYHVLITSLKHLEYLSLESVMYITIDGIFHLENLKVLVMAGSYVGARIMNIQLNTALQALFFI